MKGFGSRVKGLGCRAQSSYLLGAWKRRLCGDDVERSLEGGGGRRPATERSADWRPPACVAGGTGDVEEVQEQVVADDGWCRGRACFNRRTWLDVWFQPLTHATEGSLGWRARILRTLESPLSFCRVVEDAKFPTKIWVLLEKFRGV